MVATMIGDDDEEYGHLSVIELVAVYDDGQGDGQVYGQDDGQDDGHDDGQGDDHLSVIEFVAVHEQDRRPSRLHCLLLLPPRAWRTL